MRLKVIKDHTSGGYLAEISGVKNGRAFIHIGSGATRSEAIAWARACALA